MHIKTKEFFIRVMMGISVLSLCSIAVHEMALAKNVNPVEGGREAADSSSVEMEASISDSGVLEVPQANTSRIVAGAVQGAVRGASASYNHTEALQHRAWLEPLALAEYPMEVKYEVRNRVTMTKQAMMWGIPVRELIALNPGFSENDVLDPGIELTVLKRTEFSVEPQSVGPTNRGRIVNGWLMPEGHADSGYFLRDERQRSYASENTIRALMAGFAAYAAAYPGAPRVNIGDFSKRRGGKIKPHASHQSGRDVDIGFVHILEPGAGEPEHFKRASRDNVDVEKTWYVLKSIIATGEVKSIFIDINVQKMLYMEARKELNPQQLDAIFSYPHRSTSSHAMMQHWPGHRNHAHIRFVCPENQPRCRR